VAGGFSENADGLLPGFVAGSRVAQYRLEERVGAGGMAVVFRAWDERLDRWVALKILAPALATDELFRRRFLREARAAAAVDDPHIVPVFEAGHAGEALFIAMRYVPGGDARSLVSRTGWLSWERATAIVSSVASALDTAHGAGLVHRDVKPANILVDVRPGRPDHVYLSDFGLCRGALFWSGPSGEGQFLGTLGYAAPEQLSGKPIDGRADQYSLACSAFELLGGAPPFPHEDPGAVIWAHMSEPPPPLTSRRPELPAAVDGVLARALSKEPEDRYASCQDFASALCAVAGFAPSDREAVIGPQADHWRDETTWPGSADGGRKTSLSGPAMRPGGARHARARQPRHDRQRFRMTAMYAALLAAVLSVLGGLAQFGIFRPDGSIPAAIPKPLSAPNFLGFSVPGQCSYGYVADFAAAAGKEPNLVGCVTGWGEPFATSFAKTLYKHREIPLVQIEPAGVCVAAIAAGDYDSYLRLYADSVRNFARPVVIGFGHEMNADWYSWGYRHTPAPTFVAAWRHIVTVFRSQGADNVTWLWTIQADQHGTGPIMSWWPGANYVTWVGIDGFYTRPSDTFSSVFVSTVDQVRTSIAKPMLLSETAVPRNASQYASILNLFSGIAHYRMLGLVWFDKDESGQATGRSDPGVASQDWRLEGDRPAEQAFRLGESRLTTRRG
jgi:hypothetical protein